MTDYRKRITDIVREAIGTLGTEDVAIYDAAADRVGIPRAEQAPSFKTIKNPSAFFAAVREVTGPLDNVQVATINGLLNAAAHWPIGWVAYGLATAWGECKLRPIHEFGGAAYLSKYDTGKLAAALGNTPEADGDGIRYAGRGLVQLTGRRNYAKAGEHLGIDLLKDPDLALRPDIATRVLVWGMETGAFTGKSLATQIPSRSGSYSEFLEGRRIINGVDKSAMFAKYGSGFLAALQAGVWA